MSRKRRTPADEPFLVVRTSASDHPHGSTIAPHAHVWHQLALVTAGVATVRGADALWVAPPAWAVWIPAGTRHTLAFTGASRLRTAYLRPDWRPDLPAGLHALAVTPLLRVLVDHACAVGMLDRRDAAELAAATLIAGELGRAGPPALTLPAPDDAALAAAAHALLTGDLADAARAAGLSARTLERRFAAATGLTPARWRQRRRLVAGLEAVAAGAPVKAAAATAGYATPSAFVAAFRAAFGAPPAAWLRGQAK